MARQRIIDIHIRSEVARFLSLRNLTAAMRGRRPGPEGSVGRLASAGLNVDIGCLGMELLGAAGAAGTVAGPDETVTILQHELFIDDWLDLMVARLKYDPDARTWSLYWPDRNSKFHRYEDRAPGPIDTLLDEIERDPTGIFWG